MTWIFFSAPATYALSHRVLRVAGDAEEERNWEILKLDFLCCKKKTQALRKHLHDDAVQGWDCWGLSGWDG